MLARLRTISQASSTNFLIVAFTIITVVSIFAGILSEFYPLMGFPAVVLFIYMTFVDFRKIFYLLLFFIPLSAEVALPGGFATDLPTEPMMIILMGVFLVYVMRHSKELDGSFFKHPLSLLMLLHVGWIFITTITTSIGLSLIHI